MSERRPVLVVVDVQNGFITEDSAPVVPVIVELVGRWQAIGGDVVFTRYHNYAGSPYERLIGWTEMSHAPDTDLVPELAPNVGQSPVLKSTSTRCSPQRAPSSLTSIVGPTSTSAVSTPTAACSRPRSTPSNGTSRRGSSRTPAPATPGRSPTTPACSSPGGSLAGRRSSVRLASRRHLLPRTPASL